MRGSFRSVGLKLAGLAAVAAVWLIAPGAAGAQTIPAGSDLWVTEPNNTSINFSDAIGTTLPAGFFEPTCPAFQGEVNLGGDGLGTDTTVQRLGDLPQAPGASVPIQIVELNLVSVEPINVWARRGS